MSAPVREGARIVFSDESGAELLYGEILQHTDAGGRVVRFWVGESDSGAGGGREEPRPPQNVCG